MNTATNINTANHLYKLENIDSSKIITPVSLYQRETDTDRVDTIVAHFDERIANEPKLSYRDGNYYVFDGQHTVMARIRRNGGKHLPVLCKVYYDLTAEEEANLFAIQTGFSRQLSSGEKIRALAYSKDETAIKFINANTKIGIDVSLSNVKGRYRIRCVATAYNQFRRVGEKKYCESMKVICEAWNGDPSSFLVPLVIGVTNFVDLYYKEYDHRRLVNVLRNVDPRELVRELEKEEKFARIKRYLDRIFEMYNASISENKLVKKF